MHTKKRGLLLLMIIIISISGCYYNKEEILYPSPPCNDTGSTYSTTIVPILSTNCYKCHSTPNSAVNGSGVVLDSYNALKPYATNGILLGVINHASGYAKMPKDAAKLPDCEIAKITDWVNKGALNN